MLRKKRKPTTFVKIKEYIIDQDPTHIPNQTLIKSPKDSENWIQVALNAKLGKDGTICPWQDCGESVLVTTVGATWYILKLDSVSIIIRHELF